VENSRGPRSSSESVADKIAVRVIGQKSGRTLELDLGQMTSLALPLVATGSIQVSLARAAVIEDAFSPGGVTNTSPEMMGYPRTDVVRFSNRTGVNGREN
jgi:hypothetical protein